MTLDEESMNIKLQSNGKTQSVYSTAGETDSTESKESNSII